MITPAATMFMLQTNILINLFFSFFPLPIAQENGHDTAYAGHPTNAGATVKGSLQKLPKQSLK